MIKTLFLSLNLIIIKILSFNRLRYIFALGVLSTIIGVTLNKVIIYPTECSPANNEQITYLLKI